MAFGYLAKDGSDFVARLAMFNEQGEFVGKKEIYRSPEQIDQKIKILADQESDFSYFSFSQNGEVKNIKIDSDIDQKVPAPINNIFNESDLDQQVFNSPIILESGARIDPVAIDSSTSFVHITQPEISANVGIKYDILENEVNVENLGDGAVFLQGENSRVKIVPSAHQTLVIDGLTKGSQIELIGFENDFGMPLATEDLVIKYAYRDDINPENFL